MFHPTTAGRNASSAGAIIAWDHQVGYAMHEVCVSVAEGDRMREAKEGTSLYCVGGRGWASIPGGKAKYALEPGTVFAVTTPGAGSW